MKRFSVKIQILLFSMIPVLIIDIFLTTFNINQGLEQASQQLKSKGEITARQIASAMEFYLFSGNQTQIQRLLAQAITDTDIIYASVYNRQGELLGESRSARFSAHSSRLYFYSREPVLAQFIETEDVFQPLPENHDRRVLGWVHIYVSREQLQRTREKILIEGLLFFGGLLLVSFVLAVLISQRITRPVFSLLEQLKKVEQGDLGQVITDIAANEIGEVQRGFNSMSQSLLANRNELNQKIEQATENLREAIATLEDKNRELGLARDAAQEADRVKSQFLANISHEIRTPIKGIKGFVNLFKHTGLNRKQKRYINIIQQSTDDLNTMITELLDFSKIESGKVKVLNSEFDLFNLLETTRDGLFSSAMEKGIDLHLTIFGDTPQMLIGDPLRLKQIVRNLVGNAIKFTDSGFVSMTVYLLDEDQSKVTIQFRIEDSGIGISEQHQKNLFRAFSQLETDPNRRYSGTGLGLVISRNLARLMGGDITLKSSSGVGSTFTLRLPFTLAKQLSGEKEPNPGKTSFVFAANQRCLNEVQSILNRIGFVTETQLLENEQRLDDYRNQLRANLPYLDFIVFDLRDNSFDPTKLLDGLDQKSIRTIITHYDSALVDSTLLTQFDFVSLINTGENIAQMLIWRSSEEITQETPLIAPPKSSQLLVVDDNSMNLTLAAELAGIWGHRADVARNAREAMSLFQDNQYDLILLDLQMPEIDGRELMRMMRNHDPELDCPIVSLSANDFGEDEERELLHIGFDACLSKPLDEEKLSALLHINHDISAAPDSEQPPPPRSENDLTDPETSIDLGYSIRLAANNRPLAENMLRMFAQSIPEFLEQLQDAIKSDSRGKIAYLTHKLRGATCYTGLPRLKNILIRYDENKHGDMQELIRIAEEINHELERIDLEISQLVKPQSNSD